MKRTLLIAATALALSARAVPHAHAAGTSWVDVKGNTVLMSSVATTNLIENCRDDTKLYSCGGYILGVFDALVLTGKLCPANSSGLTSQVIAIALKYLNNNPEKWGQFPAFLIGEAMVPVFPCTQAAAQ
jgi:hypothetical protein